VRVPPGDDGVLTVRVRSASDPGVAYLVRRLPGGMWTCTCPGFTHRQRCRHIVRVRGRLAELTEDIKIEKGLL
jgi:hypothetical protein